MTNLEILAILTNVLSVLLVILNHKANWWVGVIGVVALFILFLQKGLYGQCAVQVVFFIQSIHGYFNWDEKSTIRPLVAEAFTKRDIFIIFGINAATIAMFFMGLSTDYLLAGLSMLATYLMARKFIVHWVMWILVDVLSVAYFDTLGLYSMAALYGLFVVMCIVGLQRWGDEFDQQEREKFCDFY